VGVFCYLRSRSESARALEEADATASASGSGTALSCEAMRRWGIALAVLGTLIGIGTLVALFLIVQWLHSN